MQEFFLSDSDLKQSYEGGDNVNVGMHWMPLSKQQGATDGCIKVKGDRAYRDILQVHNVIKVSFKKVILLPY